MYRIKEVMAAKGLKSVELAAKMGKSKQYISNILNGRQTMSITVLRELADAIGCTTAELLADYPACICPHCGKPIRLIKDIDRN